MKIPEEINFETRTAIQGEIRRSFVAGFRQVAYIAAGFAAVSALVSLLLIKGKDHA